MPRSWVSLLSWIVAIAFILGSALLYADRFNLVATPPELPEATNLVDRILGSADYRQAIWPVFMWTNLLFAIGFAASVAFAFNVASASGATGRLPTFRSLAATGGIMAAIASLMPIGSVEAAVWQQYCDCGFRDTEIVSQFWAQMVAQGMGDWFNRFASVVLAVALIALVREGGGLLSPMLRTWTQLTAVVLAVTPVLITVGVDPFVPEMLTVVAGVILIPVWAVWLGRSVEAGPSRST